MTALLRGRFQGNTPQILGLTPFVLGILDRRHSSHIADKIIIPPHPIPPPMLAAFVAPATFAAEFASCAGTIGVDWYVVLTGLDVGVFQYLYALSTDLFAKSNSVCVDIRRNP